MIRRFKSLGFSAMTVLVLVACAQPVDWPWDEGAGRPQVAASRLEPPGTRPTAPVAQRPAKAADLKAIRPAPRPAEAKDEAEKLLKLIGLSEDETADLLGRPVEESAEPPGKIWVYKAAGCRLSVHLFPDMEKGGFYALDYTAAEGGKEACLGKIAGEARKKGGALISSPPSPLAGEG